MKVIVASTRQPHELLFMIMSILLGLNYLLATIPSPTSVVALMPMWAVKAWAAVFLLSGLVGTVATAIRRRALLALELERGSLLLSTSALLFMTGSILVVRPANTVTFSLGILVAWMGANIWRVVQLTGEAKTLTKEVSASNGD